MTKLKLVAGTDIARKSKLQDIDCVAAYVRDCYNVSKAHRAGLLTDGGTVDAVLQACRDAYFAVPSEEERKKMADSGVYQKYSLVRFKTNIALAWARNLMQGGRYRFLHVEPSPLPDLDDEAKDLVYARLIKTLSKDGGAVETNRKELLQKHYEMYNKERMQVAQERVEALQREIDDWTAEEGFQKEFDSFLMHFFLYPYSVFLAPAVTTRVKMKWSGNKAKLHTEEVLGCEHVSPFDYYFSPDTHSAGEGSWDIVRQMMTEAELRAAAKNDGWIKGAIEEVLDSWPQYSSMPADSPFLGAETPDAPTGGQEESPPSVGGNVNTPEAALAEGAAALAAARGEDFPQAAGERPLAADGLVSGDSAPNHTVPVLKFFGVCKGGMLNKYSFGDRSGGFDDKEFYEIEAVICGDKTLSLVVIGSDSFVRRPIYSASYIKQPDNIAGIGLGQIIMPLESLYMGTVRYMMRNMAISSDPPGEVSVDKIATGNAGEYPSRLDAGLLIPVAGDDLQTGLGHEQAPAFRMYRTENYSGSLAQLANYYMQQIDNHTGIPAALSGQPVGSGANRTFRGIVQLRNNAAMTLQSAFANIDKQILAPMGEAIARQIMLTNNNDSIKGDCEVVSTGLGGLLDAEISKQTALDTMTTFIPAMAAGQIPPSLGRELTKAALIGRPITEEQINAAYAEWNGQQQMEPAGSPAAPQEMMESPNGA